MSIVAIILAAGKGERLGLGYNKMFLKLGDKPLLVHTVERFALPFIRETVVVTGKTDLEQVRELVEDYDLNVSQVVVGGRTRQESVYLGLSSLADRAPELVLIHDGARPFISRKQIEQLVETVRREGAAIMARPVHETVKVVEDGRVTRTLDRSVLWAAQTPQGFRYALLQEAHAAARRLNREGTDDAALVEELGHPVAIVPGSASNIKITTKEDVGLAEALLKREEMS